MACVTRLQLTNYRCYDSALLDGLGAGSVVLYGANGAGKTNVLEAVSLLAPGRGLRGAKTAEIQNQSMPPLPRGERKARQRGTGEGEGEAWAVAALLDTPYGEVRIGTGLDPAKADKRIVRINGVAARGQNALAEYLSCVWLTPQMDRLFIDSPGERRRFLDRLVFAFDPGHSGRVIRYENALRQRSKILQDETLRDPLWLEGLEATMAETGVAIAAARLHFMERLQQACDQAATEEMHYFPRARLNVTGTLEELLLHCPALEVEEMYAYQLRETRSRDTLTGGATTGPHKSDLAAFYAAKDMPADQCSTGEQKALLIGMVLAHARLIKAERGAPPILLLDEVAAHLDQNRRAGLYGLLRGLGGQVWLTGTDRSLFDAIGEAAFFHVEQARLSPVHRSEAA